MSAKISNFDNGKAAVSDDAHLKQEIRGLANALRHSALEVAWRQWHTLGGSAAIGAQRSRRLQSMIDPEALVLLSLLMIDDEERLADLVHDWMIHNSDLLSVQRIKNLAREYPKEARNELTSRLAWLAEAVLSGGKDPRWRSLALPMQSNPDGFGRGRERHGLAFSTKKADTAKSRAVRAPLSEPSALLLRLRLGFGVGIKADVICFLLGTRDDWITIREIAEATAYTVAAVRRAVDDLASARLVLALEAQPASYRAERRAWASFLKVEGPPVWLNWHQRFTFVAAFLTWVGAIERRPLSNYAFGAYGRDLMARHRQAFDNDRLAVWSAHTVVPDWGAFVKTAVETLASSMAEWA